MNILKLRISNLNNDINTINNYIDKSNNNIPPNIKKLINKINV